ncbi:hypothetical protein [Xylophilus ampelinus]|uniref:Uncharacterized protein n=1 Tax=Xylophilus ampelinus TaxID=54067 RepID=A0A318SWK2_9BURK|nr:hypothetical protein [Xylophilus ampelinus]MCS4511042.1 hypothetical protein [Xylophilus ampelinus]PYE75963.1 hypothetical protein DFQ15_11889 [Xylophilus ampelinus]
MTYFFNEQERADIEAARLQSASGDDPRDVKADGNWVPFYTTLSNMLGKHLAEGQLDATDQSNFRSAKLWLDVAIGANAGTGMHSAFIRAYTNRQGELRRGSAFRAANTTLLASLPHLVVLLVLSAMRRLARTASLGCVSRS